MKNFNKSLVLFVGMLASIAAGGLYAECAPSIAKDYPGAVPPNYYGNSQTDSFKCAIGGANDLSLSQLHDRNELIPVKLSNRYYIMFGGNAASEAIQQVKNESKYDTVLQGATISSTQAKTASNNIELGVGYSWSDFAIDLEWLASKSITYSGYFQQISPTIPYTSNTKGDALILDVYWFFNDQYNFKMYGLLCGGVSSNKTTATLGTSGSPTITKRISPSYGLGFGARFNIISKLFADMAARYIILGRVTINASNGTGNDMILKAYRTWLGVSARLIWMI